MIYIRFTICSPLCLTLISSLHRGVENYVGCEDYIRLAYEFDANVIIFFLMLIFEILNYPIQEWVAIVLCSYDFVEDDDNIFSVDASMKTLCAIIVWELSLFKRVIHNSYYMG